MDDTNDRQSEMNQMRIESLGRNEILLRKVIRIAQFESEIDLGVNPASLDQANTGYLTEQDFEYIKRVCVLVEKRLKDSNWLLKTLDSIDNKSAMSREVIRGVRFDDELFKAGRGILESFINESHHEGN
jgi:hypothetical protein